MPFKVYTSSGTAFEAVKIETQDGKFVFTQTNESRKQIAVSEMKAILFNGYADFIIQQSVEIGDLQLKLAKSDKELDDLKNQRCQQTQIDN